MTSVGNNNSGTIINSGNIINIEVKVGNVVNPPSGGDQILQNPYFSGDVPNTYRPDLTHVKTIVACVREQIKDRKIEPLLLARVVANCMVIVASFKLPGLDKKRLVIHSIETCIRKCMDFTEDEVNGLMILVEAFVPGLIDLTVNTGKAIVKLQEKYCDCCVVL